MEIKIVEDKKHNLVMDVKGISHGFCNALVKELWEDSKTKSAGYHVDHPLVGTPKIIFESEGDAKPALLDAIKRLQKKVNAFDKEFQKVM